MKAFCNGRGVFLGVAILIISLTVLTVGCATSKVSQSKETGAPLAHQKNQITQIQHSESGDESHVLVSGDQKLVFTSVKQSDPSAVVFYFPETTVSAKVPALTSTLGLITDIGLSELSETGQTARLEIKLSEDAPYTVVSNDNGLDIVIQKIAVTGSSKQEKTDDSDVAFVKTDLSKPDFSKKDADSPVSPATLLENIEIGRMQSGSEVKIGLNGTIDQYKSFTLNTPPRIVFDLPNIAASADVKNNIDVNSPGITRIRQYSDSQKLRIVIETQKKYLNSFSARPDQDGLLIYIGRPAVGGTAVLKNIEYEANTKGANSEVAVTTSKRVAYKVKRITPRWLRLSLLNCELPEGKIDTAEATSGVVAAIDTMSEPKQPNDTQIDIRLNETVPYLVKQENDRILVSLEAQDRLVSVKKEAPKAASSVVNASGPKNKKKIKTKTTDRKNGGQKYTGEKVALDFYNTDIHNVFRILADISGENFAIDKDVEGKVTLSLDNPVPWDQVLDLVLRMNQLDKQEDDNIIRIATLKTLKAEDEARIAKIKAKRAEEEEADVVSEYILINYADAEKDVKPHLEAILSENGKLSVDTRNNLLILTDVPTVITRAKAIVNEIDNATPQVLIEARIVEADNSFSREIGLSWNAAWGIQADDPRAGIGPQRGFDRFGGTYGYDTAVNFPFSIGSPLELGFNFARVAGTPFGLDARLRLLEINGNGRVVSAPKILTLDSQEAVITQGQEYPYFEESESGGRTVKFKKVELKLVVTPHITPDGRVSIHIKIEKKDVFSFVEGVPILNTKEAETEFLMNDRDTLVIGGIHKSTERLSQTGYPWLSKIPFLGWLFKTQSKELDKEELLIFISPKIRKMERRDINNVKEVNTVKGSLG